MVRSWVLTVKRAATERVFGAGPVPGASHGTGDRGIRISAASWTGDSGSTSNMAMWSWALVTCWCALQVVIGGRPGLLLWNMR